MPIRRPRTERPALRHVAFLEAMERVRSGGLQHRAACALFLAMRLVDNWVTFGAVVTAPGARALAATRLQLAELGADAELRSALSALVDAVAAMPTPDPQPVLPRLFALGALLERRGHVGEAGDVFRTVMRLVDPASQRDLAYEAHMRAAECLRLSGELLAADQAYAHAGMLATRDRHRDRAILARLGRARVMRSRGDLAAADTLLVELIADAAMQGSPMVASALIEERTVLATHLRAAGTGPS